MKDRLRHAAWVFAAILLATPAAEPAQGLQRSPVTLAAAGWTAIEERRFGDALEAFAEAAGPSTTDPSLCTGAGFAAFMLGQDATPEDRARVSQMLGLDQPFYVQYFVLMKKIFITGDLTSFVNRGWKVVPAVLDTIPVTLSLVIGAAVLWVIFGMLIGIVAAATRGSWLDKLLMILGLIGISMPVYWLGEVMNLVTQSRFHDTWMFSWVPPLGYKNLSDDPKGWFLTLIIPWITLAILYIGLYGRVLRASLIEALQVPALAVRFQRRA